MEIAEFRTMQQELLRMKLLGSHDLPGVMTVLAETAVSGLLAAGLAAVQPWGLAFWALQAAAGVSLFRWFVILHECGHKTLFRHGFWNTVIGHFASLFCLIPFGPWRNIHLLHHRWVGVIDKDPTQRHLLNLLRTRPVQNALFRIVWRLWLPIPFALFLYQVFWLYPLERYRAGDMTNAKIGLVSDLACLGGQAALIVTLGFGGWATYFLPMLVLFYVLIENMNLPQHSELFPHLSETHPDPIRLAEQDAITRSTHLPDWLSVLLALNFNRHTEHHLFPSAPWYALNRLRRRLLEHGYHHPHEVPFISFMWHLRQRDPMTVYRDALPKPAEKTS